MSKLSFWRLHSILEPLLPCSQRRKRKRGLTPNGDISSSLKLSIAMCYFAGGVPRDIMSSHGVSYTEVYTSVWEIVDAINSCDRLKITFPNHDEQMRIASRFEAKSSVGFDNCCGCVDGLLIWTSKPSKPILQKANLGAKKFFCGRKKKFGLNIQVICDD